jgi:hypothetical protein
VRQAALTCEPFGTARFPAEPPVNVIAKDQVLGTALHVNSWRATFREELLQVLTGFVK